mmetsp:Transcript_1915/g.3037  ORF Transcript_1915/g.3037 Transcript_1915/m.3037 type:complete len:173 (+) Transcript_1915:52-570(+)
MSNDATVPLEHRRNYTSIFNAFKRILNEEGATAFFRGCGPFVNRCMVVGAVQIGTYDQFKATYRSLGVQGDLTNPLCASMSSGLLYSLVTMPLETAKNRMAFQRTDPSSGRMLYTSTLQTVSKVAVTEGTLRLWQGFIPYYLRCGGHTVCMFVLVEYIRKVYSNYRVEARKL